ncbi:MAG: hypothetical protein M0Q15_15795 [Nevskia sp.]|jgi:hypothetical protein|nr:hypothetical protein [Nevskia sp.]
MAIYKTGNSYSDTPGAGAQRIKIDINRLVDKPLPENRLPEAVTPPAIRSKTGLERQKAGDVNSEQVTAESTDGLFTFTVRVVKA